jgi:hypothetical protein
MRAVEKRINGVKGKILVKQFLSTVYDFTCKYCGKHFEATNRNRKFCCVRCYRKSALKNDYHEKICPICWKTFSVAGNSNKTYCSVACRHKREFEAYKVIKKCAYCWKEYRWTKSSKFCCKKCRQKERHKQYKKDEKEIRRIIEEEWFNYTRCRKWHPKIVDMELLVKCVKFIRWISEPFPWYEEIMDEINNHPLPI